MCEIQLRSVAAGSACPLKVLRVMTTFNWTFPFKLKSTWSAESRDQIRFLLFHLREFF